MTEQDLFPGTSGMDNVYTKIWETYKSECVQFITRVEGRVLRASFRVDFVSYEHFKATHNPFGKVANTFFHNTAR